MAYPLPPNDPTGHASRLLDACAADAAAGNPPTIISRRGSGSSLAAGVVMMATALAAAPADAAKHESTWSKLRDLTAIAQDANALRSGGGLDDSRASRASIGEVSRTLGALSSASRRLERIQAGVEDAEPNLAPRGPGLR